MRLTNISEWTIEASPQKQPIRWRFILRQGFEALAADDAAQAVAAELHGGRNSRRIIDIAGIAGHGDTRSKGHAASWRNS